MPKYQTLIHPRYNTLIISGKAIAPGCNDFLLSNVVQCPRVHPRPLRSSGRSEPSWRSYPRKKSPRCLVVAVHSLLCRWHSTENRARIAAWNARTMEERYARTRRSQLGRTSIDTVTTWVKPPEGARLEPMYLPGMRNQAGSREPARKSSRAEMIRWAKPRR